MSASIADACVMHTGHNTVCGQIACQIIDTRAEVARVARLANKSPRRFAEYADELSAAKEAAVEARRRRDQHMAECPAAADRFGARSC